MLHFYLYIVFKSNFSASCLMFVPYLCSFQNSFNITNSNYMPIRITHVEMSVLYDTQILALHKNKSVVEIPMRAERLYSIDINITMDKDNQMGYMA